MINESKPTEYRCALTGKISALVVAPNGDQSMDFIFDCNLQTSATLAIEDLRRLRTALDNQIKIFESASKRVKTCHRCLFEGPYPMCGSEQRRCGDCGKK